MADNYLERRSQELSSGRTIVRRNTPSLDTLLRKNRSHRGFDASYKVHMRQLEAIASVNTKLASGRNAQTLRFRLVDADGGGETLCSHLHLGGFLPELHLPFAGQEPKAFIVVCGTEPECPTVDIDLGISLQSMSLKAVELGLNALIVRAFDREPLRRELGLELEPLAVLAIGKGTDHIELVEVSKDADLRYYREDGVHYVPKIGLKDLLV